jgi:hypothetical protein
VNVQATPWTPKELRSAEQNINLLTTHQTGSDVGAAHGLGEHEEKGHNLSSVPSGHLELSGWNKASHNGDTEDLKKPHSSPSSQNLEDRKRTTSKADLKGEASTKRRETSFDSLLDSNDRAGENPSFQHLSDQNLLGESHNRDVDSGKESASAHKKIIEHNQETDEHLLKEVILHLIPAESTLRYSIPSTSSSENQFGMFEFDAGVFGIPDEFQPEHNAVKLQRMMEIMFVGNQLYIDETN